MWKSIKKRATTDERFEKFIEKFYNIVLRSLKMYEITEAVVISEEKV